MVCSVDCGTGCDIAEAWNTFQCQFCCSIILKIGIAVFALIVLLVLHELYRRKVDKNE